MNEGALKTKWRRHAHKQGFETRSLSPHQIPGLPDIVAVDRAASDLIRQYRRVRNHWIEAKVFQERPMCFDAKRDATANQVSWIWGWNKLGCSTWWLVLGESRWMLIPGDQLKLSRSDFERRSKRYGDRISELCEPERNRLALAAKMAEVLDGIKVRVAEMFDG